MVLKTENIRLRKEKIFKTDKQRIRVVSRQNSKQFSEKISEKLFEKLKKTFANTVYSS